MPYTLFIARRYFFSRKQKTVINIISWISLVGIAVSTAALIVVLSVYNGIGNLTQSLFNSFDPELLVQPAKGKTFHTADLAFDQLQQMPEVAAVSQMVEENRLHICHWFTVDDWVYYTDRCHYPEFTDNYIQAPVLHRRKEDGTQDTRVAELPIAAATCESGCLYCQPDSHYGSGLYRTRPNGSEAQQIYDEPINRFYFDGGCLYILDPYGLLRLSTDGSTRERIIDSSEYSAVGISDISFDDKCIYYLADLPGDWLNNQYLYRVNKDGSQKAQLTQTTTRAYAVSGDSVYFVGGDSAVSDQHLYRLTKTDHRAAMVSWRRVDSDRDSLLYDGTFLYVYFIDGTEHDDCMGDSWETSHLYKIKCDK